MTTGVAGTARITPEGVDGSIAVAVVCVAWKGERMGQLALAVLGYSVTLWLAHIYARVFQGGWDTRNLAVSATGPSTSGRTSRPACPPSP